MLVPLISTMHRCPEHPLQSVLSGTFVSSSVSHCLPLIHLPALTFLATVSPSSDFISFSLLLGPISSPIWILHPLCREAAVPVKFILELQSGTHLLCLYLVTCNFFSSSLCHVPTGRCFHSDAFSPHFSSYLQLPSQSFPIILSLSRLLCWVVSG